MTHVHNDGHRFTSWSFSFHINGNKNKVGQWESDMTSRDEPPVISLPITLEETTERVKLQKLLVITGTCSQHYVATSERLGFHFEVL